MDEPLEVGGKVPPFAVPDHKGFVVTDEDLLGSPCVLFFYPKDGTPGCTKECLAFQEALDTFDRRQVLVIGVSPDTKNTHQEFRKEHSLQFTLLADEKKDLAMLFGALDNEGNLIRTTFLLDGKGSILWIEKPVKLDGHVERVVEAVQQLTPLPEVRGISIARDYRAFFERSLRQEDADREIEKRLLKRLGLEDEEHLGHNPDKKQ